MSDFSIRLLCSNLIMYGKLNLKKDVTKQIYHRKRKPDFISIRLIHAEIVAKNNELELLVFS